MGCRCRDPFGAHRQPAGAVAAWQPSARSDCAHIAVFFLASVLTMRSFWKMRELMIAGSILLLFGIALEVLQTRVYHNRAGDLRHSRPSGPNRSWRVGQHGLWELIVYARGEEPPSCYRND